MCRIVNIRHQSMYQDLEVTYHLDNSREEEHNGKKRSEFELEDDVMMEHEVEIGNKIGIGDEAEIAGQTRVRVSRSRILLPRCQAWRGRKMESREI